MADDHPDTGPSEGDTGATGRSPRPPRQSDREFDELDSSFTDEPAEPISFFEEESEPEPVRRPPVEDFGFDEIAQDDEPASGARARSARRAASGRGGSGGARSGGATKTRGQSGSRRTSSGSGRGGARRGPRGGGPSSPLSSPGVRIALGIAFVALLVIVLALVVRDCRRDAMVDSYKTYVNSAGKVADESAAQGQALLVIMQNRDRSNATVLQTKVRELATQADALVRQGESLDPPDGLGDADRDLQTVLRYRANALDALAQNIPAIIRSGNARSAAQNIATPMKRFLASDVIYKDSFVDVVAAKVRDEGIAGLEVATDAFFLKGANDRYSSEAGARTLLTALKRSGGSSTGGSNTGGNLRGTSLGAVVASSSNTTLNPDTVTTIVASESLEWMVTVTNGGDFVENEITVVATLRYPGNTEAADTQESVIDTIDAGEEKTVNVPGPPADAWQPGVEGTLEITVKPVEGETNTANNTREFPVTITAG